MIEAIPSHKSHHYSGLQNPARRIRCSSHCACHHLSCDYLSPSTQTMATEHGLLSFGFFFFKEKEVVLVWDPYIFLGSPVSLYDCTTMTNNHTESWVSWSPALWLNQNVRKIENVIWVSFHSCIHSVICSFIKCLLNWLNYSERNELCSLPTHSSERSRWQWVWVYGGGWQRRMPKSLWPKKRKTEENTFSRESLGKGQEAVGVINSPQIQERSHECDGI